MPSQAKLDALRGTPRQGFPTSLEMAQSLRGFERNSPWLAGALGFVPGVGSLYGAASTAAALRDPDASTLEKGIAGASMLPFGSAIKALRGKSGPKSEIIAHDLGVERLREAGAPIDIQTSSTGGKLAEIPDPWVPTHALGTHAPEFKSLEEMTDLSTASNQFFDAYPELKTAWLRQSREMDPNTGSYTSAQGGNPLIQIPVPRSTGQGAMQNARDSLSHELQHAAQDLEPLLSEAQRGSWIQGIDTDPEIWMDYLRNPGEIEARLNALRQQSMNKRGMKEYPFTKHYEDALRDLDKYTPFEGAGIDNFERGNLYKRMNEL